MPATKLYRKDEKGSYFHIYNKGVEERVIFNDGEDYEVFRGFLKDYLTAPQDPESIKKVFTVHGRVFRGMPHQPKNYFNKVELIAYCLMPEHFNLVLYQKTRGSIENFIRSLCTRYSIYFNKKHGRTGGLFEGPYKSIHIDNKLRLLHLTRYLHHNGGYTSYAEYLGTRTTSWVKSDDVLSFLDKEMGNYKDFVEEYVFDQKEKELLKDIIFNGQTGHLERRDPTRKMENYSPKVHPESIGLGQNLHPLKRVPEFLAAAIVFFLLVSFGIRNILISTTKNPNFSPTPSILSETVEIEQATPSSTPSILSETEQSSTPSAEVEEPKIMLTVTVDDKLSIVNIREKPTTRSEKIAKAKDGDIFEFVSIESGWYEVKLADGSTGFISAKYIEAGETNN